MNNIPKIQKVIAILWPSFLMAGAATVVFFTAFNPAELFLSVSTMAAYSIGFFSFWGLTASSCMLTCYFQRPCLRPGQQAETQNESSGSAVNTIRMTHTNNAGSHSTLKASHG